MSEPKGILARLKEFERRSPKLTRKFETPKLPEKPEMSVSLSEVEDKLKLMKQKRLSRLNMHVEEQTKLSEARKNNKGSDGEDLDEVVIRNHDKVPNFSPKPHHRSQTDSRTSPERRVPGSPKKSSSAKRFINKFSCVNEELMSSNEELNTEPYGQPARKSLPNRLDISKMHKVAASKSNQNILEEASFIRNSLTRHSDRSPRSSKSLDFRSSNQNISEMITQEVARNKMSDDEYSQRTVTHETFGKATTPTTTPKTPKFSEANFLDVDPAVENEGTKDNLREEEPKQPLAVERQVSQPVKEQEGRSGAEALTESLHTKDTTEVTDLEDEAKKHVKTSEIVCTNDIPVTKTVETEGTLYENINFETNSGGLLVRKTPAIDTKISKNPIPVPRKPTKEERVVRKFQENLTVLRDVIKNESEVDFDEIESFKHTLEEMNGVVGEYKAAVDTVEVKFVPLEKLRRIRVQVEEIRDKVQRFKGLKRDMAYLELSNMLSSQFFKVKNMSVSSAEGRKLKELLLYDINSCIRVLEEKVSRNEAILLKILQEQVELIQTKILVPTLV